MARINRRHCLRCLVAAPFALPLVYDGPFPGDPQISLLPKAVADVLILKDGTTLVGKIRREGSTILEAGQMVKVGNGFWALDDDQTLPERKDFYVRRFIYSQRLVQDVDEKAAPKDNQTVVLRLPMTPFSTATKAEPFGQILESTPWDNNWERNFKFQPLKQAAMTTKQRITFLTPYCFCVESSRVIWQQMYLTRELGPEATLRLLYSHPDLREKEGATPDPAKRSKIIRFLKQAGFYDAAERELDLWMRDAPAQKDQIEEERGDMRKLRAREMVEELDTAYKAGRHQWVEKQLSNFPKELTDSKQFRTLQTKFEEAGEKLTDARRLLKDLPPRVSPEAHRILFTEAAAAILRELNIDNHQRLDTFVALGKQAERDTKAGKPVTHSPADLMGLAVSGWLLGNGSAEAKAVAGIRLWNGRKFIFEYLKTEAAPARQQLAELYPKTETDPLAFDELAQVISLLPPVDPEERLSTDVMPLETKLPWGGTKGINYLVQLPREYTHGRPYPVLVVLHQGIEKAADTLDRWVDLAQRHGYILVAPEWSANQKQQYNYSALEHQAVLDSIRDLQRRFNVDCERIFLAGAGQGGDMAYDIGLSHPDMFAGVAVMGAQPRFFAKAYAVNGYHLPFYVVAGELASEAPKAIREQFKTWVLRGHPSLYVEYKGRGQEWFAGELPNIFDWMNRKKRATATPELPEVWSMRPTDNRFYWLSADNMNKGSINDISNWKPLMAPATLQGRLAENNTINLHVKNYQRIYVWLARGMVDFEKPVTVMLNTGTKLNQRKITPNIATLLEDFYLRGDRQRLFVAKIELTM